MDLCPCKFINVLPITGFLGLAMKCFAFTVAHFLNNMNDLASVWSMLSLSSITPCLGSNVIKLLGL